MSFFDDYLTPHAAALLRIELWFALMVLAVGCGIALHGAVHAHDSDVDSDFHPLIGESPKSSSSLSEAQKSGWGQVPVLGRAPWRYGAYARSCAVCCGVQG